jgi:uncharacterized protein (DUF1800 family)
MSTSFSSQWVKLIGVVAGITLLFGCGGGADSATTASEQTSEDSAPDGSQKRLAQAESNVAGMTTLDAVRLAQQATFGPNENLITEIKSLGAERWIAAQLLLPRSQYTSGQTDLVHKTTSPTPLCDQSAYKGPNCWRDWLSSTPLVWDFYRNATTMPDQLRQRVAFALSQILVVSDLDVSGSYGFRYYNNTTLHYALHNYRDILKKAILSPLMGAYLNNVNNDAAAPNENFARELLQLFTIGTCELKQDGSLAGGKCIPTYNNETVRNYAYALTGWTYPAGGFSPNGCRPAGTNCIYLAADMVPAPALHDTNVRPLLYGMTVAAGSTPATALGDVMNSLMGHPNMAPFIGRRLIQHLVTSNPSPGYIARVSAAFTTGRYVGVQTSFGTGRRGDLAATVAAILLDPEARATPVNPGAGKLREPVLMFTGVIRALNGISDGDALGGWWGAALNEHVFRAPSVFNFFPPNSPVPGADIEGPEFGIHGAQANFDRLNFLSYMIFYNGVAKNPTVPNATGTSIKLSSFENSAADPAALVDRLSVLAVGGPLPEAARNVIVDAVASFSNTTTATWKADRVAQAAYLVFASPQYQVQR